MKRSARVAWLGSLALALAVVAAQTTITPVARAQSAAPSVTAGDLGTLAAFQAVVQPLGFVGSSSPTADGTPRWLALRTSDGAQAEAIGPEDALSKVTFSLRIPTQGDSSTQLQDLVTFLTTYSPSGEFFVIAAVGMAPVSKQDQTQTFDNRSVHVTATQSSDGTDVLVEVTPASGAQSSGEPTFAFPSFEIPSFAIPSFEIPSFAIPSFSIPSFAPDADLAAKFPTTIDGQPVTNVETFFFIDLLRFEGETDAQIQAVSQALASFGVDLTSVSAGTGQATVDGEPVHLSALRAPGADAANIAAHYNEIQAGVNAALGQPVPSSPPTLTQSTVGGKNVTIATDSDGAVTILYAAGDTLWSLSDVTDSQAAKVLAALQ